MTELQSNLIAQEKELNNSCRNFGFTINDFYNNPRNLPIELLSQNKELIDSLHDTLESIFSLKHGSTSNIKFIADFR